MRTSKLALFAAAAVLSLSASAQPQAAASDVVEVRATPAKPAYVNPVMHRNMQGVYKLDDGRTLKVSSRGRKLTMDLGTGASEIVHVGGNRFEAVGKDASLRFDHDMYPDSLVLAERGGREVASTQR